MNTTTIPDTGSVTFDENELPVYLTASKYDNVIFKIARRLGCPEGPAYTYRVIYSEGEYTVSWSKVKTTEQELREALAACVEDSIELLGERGFWKDEPRCGYARRYAETQENITRAQELLKQS